MYERRDSVMIIKKKTHVEGGERAVPSSPQRDAQGEVRKG